MCFRLSGTLEIFWRFEPKPAAGVRPGRQATARRQARNDLDDENAALSAKLRQMRGQPPSDVRLAPNSGAEADIARGPRRAITSCEQLQ
jgi:hypothetical protein